MDQAFLFNIFEKFLIDLIIDLKIEVTQKFKKKILNSCLTKINQISTESGKLCEKKGKTTISEGNFLFILNKLNLGRFICEINEEKNRIGNENLRLEQLYS